MKKSIITVAATSILSAAALLLGACSILEGDITETFEFGAVSKEDSLALYQTFSKFSYESDDKVITVQTPFKSYVEHVKGTSAKVVGGTYTAYAFINEENQKCYGLVDEESSYYYADDGNYEGAYWSWKNDIEDWMNPVDGDWTYSATYSGEGTFYDDGTGDNVTSFNLTMTTKAGTLVIVGEGRNQKMTSLDVTMTKGEQTVTASWTFTYGNAEVTIPEFPEAE